MIILLIIYMSDSPTSADLSNTEESRHQLTLAGLSNIGESKRRLGYQLHKIGYTLCVARGGYSGLRCGPGWCAHVVSARVGLIQLQENGE